jgi:hypothetical protein
MTPAKQIDVYISSLPEWQSALVAQFRAIVIAVKPEITEEWKWSTPVWSHNGLVCACGVFKDHLRLNFFQGARLPEFKAIFNSGLDAKVSRGVVLKQGDILDTAGLSRLISAATALNISK